MMDSASVEEHVIAVGGDEDLEAQFADDEGLTSDGDSHRMVSSCHVQVYKSRISPMTVLVLFDFLTILSMLNCFCKL